MQHIDEETNYKDWRNNWDYRNQTWSRIWNAAQPLLKFGLHSSQIRPFTLCVDELGQFFVSLFGRGHGPKLGGIKVRIVQRHGGLQAIEAVVLNLVLIVVIGLNEERKVGVLLEVDVTCAAFWKERLAARNDDLLYRFHRVLEFRARLWAEVAQGTGIRLAAVDGVEQCCKANHCCA